MKKYVLLLALISIPSLAFGEGKAALGLEFNLSERVGANVQGRYGFGLRDVDESTTEVRTRAFYAIVGLSVRDAF